MRIVRRSRHRVIEDIARLTLEKNLTDEVADAGPVLAGSSGAAKRSDSVRPFPPDADFREDVSEISGVG